MFCLRELLSDGLGQFVNLFGLRGDFGRKLFLSFGQTLFGQLGSPVAIVDERLQVFGGLKKS
jgi:hypothetical protein